MLRWSGGVWILLGYMGGLRGIKILALTFFWRCDLEQVISRCLSFLIYKTRMIAVNPSQGCCKD